MYQEAFRRDLQIFCFLFFLSDVSIHFSGNYNELVY